MQKIGQTLTSMDVAEMVKKEHKYLMRDIRNYSTDMTGAEISPVEFWIESTYSDSKGQIRPCYAITKKGCEFIAHKLHGKKGTEFTATYINRFHEMEGALEAQTGSVVIQQFIEQQQGFMEYQRRLVEELLQMNRSISDRLLALESSKEEPLTLTVGSGSKPFTVIDDENATRKKKLNKLVTRMAKACGWTRSFALHRLYKTLEEVLNINIDDYVDLYKEEIQGDACAIDAVVVSENLYTTAIRLCNNTLSKMSVEVQS